LQLIKIACAKAKADLRYVGQLNAIKVGDYDTEIGGHIVVVELPSKDRPLVAGGDKVHAQ
jgi:hypothetical protein